MPVKQLIINMSVPMMISMIVQAMYNIVDSIFVARLSEDALAAVSLAYPMQNLMIAFSSGTGVGINAILSRALGERDFKHSDCAANNGILLNLFNVLIFVMIGIFGAGPFMTAMSSSEAIREYGTVYLRIISTLSLGLFMQVTFERLLQSTGKTVGSMISQMTGAIINIIFDPIMIFGLCGFPKLGVAGAAYATCLGQTVAATLGLILNLKTNKEIHFSLASVFHPDIQTVKKIYIVGVPSILMMSIGSVMTAGMNLILKVFSSTAQAVFGVYFKLQSFFFMPIFGLNSGIIPILAFNYGARKKKRIDEALAFALKLAVCIMLLGTLCFELFPKQLLSLFDASSDMLAIGIPALRIIGVHFPIAACCIILGSTFQAFSKSTYSLIVSLCRQLIVLLPVAWIFAQCGSLNLVWLSFPIAEVMSLAVTIICFRKLYRDIISKLDEA